MKPIFILLTKHRIAVQIPFRLFLHNTPKIDSIRVCRFLTFVGGTPSIFVYLISNGIPVLCFVLPITKYLNMKIGPFFSIGNLKYNTF